MADLELYSDAALRVDLPAQRLRRGDPVTPEKPPAFRIGRRVFSQLNSTMDGMDGMDFFLTSRTRAGSPRSFPPSMESMTSMVQMPLMCSRMFR
jgi:hypothetical protein